jgi:hypothetical protein
MNSCVWAYTAAIVAHEIVPTFLLSLLDDSMALDKSIGFVSYVFGWVWYCPQRTAKSWTCSQVKTGLSTAWHGWFEGAVRF